MPDQRDQLSRIEQAISQINKRLDKGSDRMTAIETNLAKNTEATELTRDIIQVTKAGFKVLGWLGVLVKWAAPIAGAVVGLWHVFHGDSPNGK